MARSPAWCQDILHRLVVILFIFLLTNITKRLVHLSARNSTCNLKMESNFTGSLTFYTFAVRTLTVFVLNIPGCTLYYSHNNRYTEHTRMHGQKNKSSPKGLILLYRVSIPLVDTLTYVQIILRFTTYYFRIYVTHSPKGDFIYFLGR